MRMHAKKNATRSSWTTSWGCDKAGKLVALGGGHAFRFRRLRQPSAMKRHRAGRWPIRPRAYAIPNVHVKGTAVITNNASCGAMRGFGATRRPSASNPA